VARAGEFAHTQALATHLDRIAEAHPDAAIVALLGNLQAIRVTRSLREAGHRVSAVLLAHDGGYTWVCGEPSPRRWPSGRVEDPVEDPIERLRGLDCRETLLSPDVERSVGRLAKWDPLWAAVVNARSDGRFRLYRVDPERVVFDYVFPMGEVSPSVPAFSPR
jgi:hypothetical protein